MDLPFGFPKRRHPDPDETDDRPLPTDAEVEAYLKGGHINKTTEGSVPPKTTEVTSNLNLGENNIPTSPVTGESESRASIPTPISGSESKG